MSLIHRSKSSVILTAAGEKLLSRCKEGFAEVERGFFILQGDKTAAAKRVRIRVAAEGAAFALAPVIAEFAGTGSGIQVDVVNATTNGLRGEFDVDIISAKDGRDADTALRIGRPQEYIMVASASYAATHENPVGPVDLRHHQCIGVRTITGDVLPWTVGRGREQHEVNFGWATIVSDWVFAVDLARRGCGIMYCLKGRVLEWLTSGDLVEVLPSWSPEPEAFLHQAYRG